MLSAADLAMMAGVMGVTHQTPCTILRKSSVSDGMGGSTDTWATLATTVCRVGLAGGQAVEAVDQLRIESINHFAIGLPLVTGIDIKDRITLTDGTVFEVVSIQTPRTYMVEILVQAETVVT